MNIKHTCFGLLCLAMATNVMAKTPYPVDVKKTTERADACFHFMGEFSGDPAIDGPRKLNQKIDFYCKNIDKDLKKLNQKYKNNHAIKQKLAEYDDLLSL